MIYKINDFGQSPLVLIGFYIKLDKIGRKILKKKLLLPIVTKMMIWGQRDAR